MVLPVPVFLSAMVFAALAGAVSMFLFIKTLKGGRLPGCGPGSACDSVTTSRWARWWSVPVALPASLLYLSIVGILLLHRSGVALPDLIAAVLASLSLLAIGGAIWFIVLQAFVLRRFCVWCMVDHLAGIAAATILLLALWPAVQAQPGLPLAIALTPLAVLIIGQLRIEPKTYEVQKPEDTTLGEPPAEPEPPPANNEPPPPVASEREPVPAPSLATASLPHAPPPSPPPPRMLALLEGRLKISTAAFPLLGPADATHVLIDMLDYTCEHCRELHHWLTQARGQFQGRLAILAIPLPMESACNPIIQLTNPKHVNACTYVRYALAVWNADRARFQEYHEWLYAPPKPPHMEDARGQAEQLVGPQAFAAALASPAVETQIQNAIGVFKFLGAGQIPKLVMNRGVLVGQVRSLERLMRVLDDDFNPPKPAAPAEVTTTFIGGFK